MTKRKLKMTTKRKTAVPRDVASAATTLATAATSSAAAALGRVGGQSKSPKLQAARRRNGKLGGRPRRVCADCGEPVRSFHRDPALDATCATRTFTYAEAEKGGR